MGSVEVGCEGSWLPHPEEQLFLDQLYTFMDRRGSPIHKVPNLGFKKSESDISCPVCVVNMCSGQTRTGLHLQRIKLNTDDQMVFY